MQKALAKLDAIEPVIALLKHGSDGAKERAARSLQITAAKGAERAKWIVDAGGTKPLLELLHTASQPVHVLERRSQNGKSEHAAVHALALLPGAIRPLVELLRDCPDSAKLELWGYSSGGVSRVLVKRFVDLLSIGPSDDAKMAAAGGIASLATIKGAKTTIAEMGAIMLVDGPVHSKVAAAGALADLSAYNAKNKMAIATNECLRALLKLKGKEAPDRALRILSGDADIKERISQLQRPPRAPVPLRAPAPALAAPATENARLVTRWHELSEGVRPDDGPLPDPEDYVLDTRACNSDTKGCTGLYVSYRDRTTNGVVVTLSLLPLEELPERTEANPTPHLRCLHALKQRLLKHKALQEGDKIRFCIGFAIDANNVLQRRSCANEQAFGAGRDLPEAQYDSLYQMLKDKRIRCIKQT